MNRLLNASLLSLVAVASLGTVACTAETAESNGPASATTQSPAELLAGEGGTQTAPVKGYGTGQTITSGKATLVVDGTSYDLLSYSFGISNRNEASSGSATNRGSIKAALAELSIMVRPSATEAVLRKAVFDGEAHSARILLFPTAEAGMTAPKPLELAAFEGGHVNAVATSAGGEPVEAYSISASKVTLSYAGAKVMYDASQATVDQNGACGAEGAASLPVYTVADAADPTRYPLVPGAVRMDSVSVGVSNTSSIGSATTGASSGKAQLDGITVAGTLEKGGICGFYYSAVGSILATAKVGIAGAVMGKTKAYESTSWTACVAAVEAVQISSAGTGAPIEVLQLQAGGLLRTDRTINPKTLNMSESSVGWSFVNNGPIAACADVVVGF